MSAIALELERVRCGDDEPARASLTLRALAFVAATLARALAFAGGALDRLVRFVPSAAPVAGVGHRMLAAVGSQLYGAAASAAVLPSTAAWLTVAGLTLADSDTTVNAWASSRGGVAATLTAPAATNRPAYTAGAVPVLTFDGVDNCLGAAVTKGSNWTSHEFGMVGSRVAMGSAADMCVGMVAGVSFVTGTSDRIGGLAMQSGAAAAGTVGGTSDPDDNVAHWSGDNAGGGTSVNNARKNGAVEGTGTPGAYVTRLDATSVICLGGNTVAAGNFGNWAFRAAYVGPSLSADQRTYLRALLTAATGVSC